MASYSDIKTDSPWRWASLSVVGGLWCLTIAEVLGWEFSLQDVAALFAVIAPIQWVVASKVGARDPSREAGLYAQAIGGVRVNAHPAFARSMIAIGAVMVGVLFVRLLSDYVADEHRNVWQRIVWSGALTPC